MNRIRTFLPLLAVLLVLLVLGGYSMYSNNQVIVESERLRLDDRLAMVESLAGISDVTYEGAKGFMSGTFATIPFTFAPDSAEDKATLGQGSQGYGAVSLLAPDGTPRTLVGGLTNPPAADDPVYAEITRRAYAGITVSPTAFAEGVPMVGLSTTVERDGAVAGIVTVFLRLDIPSSPNLFSSPVERSANDPLSGLLVIDDQGRVVGGDDLSRVGHRLDIGAAPWRQVMQGQGHAVYDDGDVSRVVVYAPAKTGGLVLAIVENASEFYGSVREDRQRGMTATLVVILAAAVALVVLTYRRQRSLDHSERRLAALLGNAADAVLVIHDDRVAYAGPGTEGVLLRSPDELRGAGVDMLMPDVADANPVVDLCASARMVPGETCTTEVSFTDSGGATRFVTVNALDRTGDPAVRGMVLTFHDVTEQRLLHEQVVHQAWHDSLTDLPNRALFADRLDNAMRNRARRNRGVAVLFLDLDGFKPVNDTYGHNAGDLVLQAVAGRCQAVLRDGDTVARMGGDEFAVIAEGSSVDDVEGLAHRLVSAVEKPVDIGGRQVRVGVSIGVAVAGVGDHLAADDLLRYADLAMYEAKDGGGDGFRVHVADAEAEASATRPADR